MHTCRVTSVLSVFINKIISFYLRGLDFASNTEPATAAVQGFVRQVESLGALQALQRAQVSAVLCTVLTPGHEDAKGQYT